MDKIGTLIKTAKRSAWLRKSKLAKQAFASAINISRFGIELIKKRSVLNNIAYIPLEVIEVENYRNTFCGYYDVSPFHPNDSKQLLVHCNNFRSWVKPSTWRTTDLVLYNRETGQTKVLDSTKAWNWQQGSRMQWLDTEHVVYNSYQKCVQGTILNALTGEKQYLPVNISIAFRNQYVISMDYTALTEGSEYGYPGMAPEHDSDEIKRYWIARENSEVLFSTRELKDRLARPASSRCHINHILINPTGDHFVFIFRFWEGVVRFDSLIVFDFSPGIWRVLVSNEAISHYAWRNDHELLVWAIIAGVPGYYRIDTQTGSIKLFKSCNDGHPNFVNDKTVITDILDSWYSGFILLYLLDIDNGGIINLLEISHPVVFCSTNRCDMHVSLSSDHREFQIDSRHRGSRSVIIGALPNLAEDIQ